MKILHLDNNHPLLISQLNEAGYTNHEDYSSSKQEVEAKIKDYQGIVIRSRFKVDKTFLEAATNLKFIARVGAGLESIDLDLAAQKNIALFSAPEGNLRGFNVEVICYDIKEDVDDSNAEQVELQELFEKTDVLSLHTPWTPLTNQMINKDFIAKFKKPFWLINTARGKSVVTKDLVQALNSGKIKGAGLDVLEYEKLSFEKLFVDQMPAEFKELLAFDNVMLSPHVAGWTVESKEKLAQTIVDKVINEFGSIS